jgi:hypothetical protein
LREQARRERRAGLAGEDRRNRAERERDQRQQQGGTSARTAPLCMPSRIVASMSGPWPRRNRSTIRASRLEETSASRMISLSVAASVSVIAPSRW